MNIKILYFLFFIGFFSIKTETILQKAFLHVGNSQDTLAFYFNEDPKVDFATSKIKKNIYEQIFLFSKITITNEANKMINRINNNRSNFYNLKILKNPDDLELKISYDPKKVLDLQMYAFPAITTQKGVSINILHKPISDKKSAKKNIIIDIGHGGKDTGAIGVSGIKEKDITYKIGMNLYNCLKKFGFNVYLTRNKDIFVDLDKRTSFANSISGESIFISIHANHSNNNKACGVESHYLDYDLLKSLRLRTLCSAQGDREGWQFDSNKTQQNKNLCETLHNKLIKDLKSINKNLVDRKTKKSVSQVLLGSQMPAVLIEVGFISSAQEEKLLKSPQYIQAIANSLCSGIVNYFDSIKAS